MTGFGRFGIALVCLIVWGPLGLTACGSPTATPLVAGSMDPASASPSPMLAAPTAPASSPAPAAPDDLGLSQPGDHGVGKSQLVFIDAHRNHREIPVSVYYPASTPGSDVAPDAAPDLSGAPYPIVLASDKMAALMGPHLASHGFVFVGGIGQSTWDAYPDPRMIDYPIDLMVALDGMETLADDDPLAGIADTNRAGVMGYSFGSWTALMLAGARVDPAFYQAQCASPPETWDDGWTQYQCGHPEGWEAMATRAQEAGVATPEGMWERIGDERIRAAMPMGPEGFDLTGPTGLEDVTIPVMLIAAGNDTNNTYPLAAVPLFEHLDPALTSMITFADANHFMIFESDAVTQFRRLALAFFGYRLAGIDTYSQALTPGFVETVAPTFEEHPTYRTLIWGVDDHTQGTQVPTGR